MIIERKYHGIIVINVFQYIIIVYFYGEKIAIQEVKRAFTR
jgi:hypothetical protein